MTRRPLLAFSAALAVTSAPGCGAGANVAPQGEEPAKAVAENPNVAASSDAITSGPVRGCSGTELDALAAELGSVAEADGPMFAVRGLVDRCDSELPPRLRWFLRTLLPEHNDELMRTQEADAAELGIWEAACPGHVEILASVMQTPSSERAAFLFDRCGFERFALMTKQELAERPFSGLAPWVSHHWLLERGTSDEAARLISRDVFAQVDVVNSMGG